MENSSSQKILELINSISSGYLTIQELWEMTTGGDLCTDFHLPLNDTMVFNLTQNERSIELEVITIQKNHNNDVIQKAQLWLQNGWHIKRSKHSIEMKKRVVIQQRFLPRNPKKFVGRIIRSLKFP